MTSDQILSNFYPLVIRLNKSDWFTSQTSVAPLVSVVYTHSDNEKQEELRSFVFPFTFW